MERYAKNRRCRRAALIGYFGERIARCSGCDVCSGGPIRPLSRPEAERRLTRLRTALGHLHAPWGGCPLEPETPGGLGGSSWPTLSAPLSAPLGGRPCRSPSWRGGQAGTGVGQAVLWAGGRQGGCAAGRAGRHRRGSLSSRARGAAPRSFPIRSLQSQRVFGLGRSIWGSMVAGKPNRLSFCGPASFATSHCNILAR